MKGYTGKILTIDLTTGESKSISLKDEVYEMILSGAGLGTWWIYRHLPPNTDALSPDNILAITSGLLTSTGSCITGRWIVVTKSPATGGLGEANCGGTFAPGIKACGYDAIFVSGRAEKPVYIYIDNKGVQIRDAAHIWGKDATVAEDMMMEESWEKGKKKPVVCTIGQAGENLSWMAGVCNDHGRIAARQGVGGVMGSKNLKGIALAGTKPVTGEDPEGIKELSKKCAKRVKLVSLPPMIPTGILNVAYLLPELALAPDGLFSAVMMGTWGTAGASQFAALTGEAPIKNWGGSLRDFGILKGNRVDGSAILRYQTSRYFCYSCVYGCGGNLDITRSKYSKGLYHHSHKPEYETQWVYTGILLSDDCDMMLYMNEYLNRAGMDSISAGHAVAMAIECCENGLLDRKDFGGLKMTWGDSHSIIEFTKMMVERRGMGDIFADGVKRAAQILGPETEKYAVHVGGTEPAMHDSRSDPNLAAFYSVDATPGRHTTGGAMYYGCMHLWKKVSWAPSAAFVASKEEDYHASKVTSQKVIAGAYYRRLIDGVGGCYFAMILGVGTYPVFEWLNCATGWNKTPDEYMVIGKRVWTLRQMFNIHEGLDPWYSRGRGRVVGEPPLKVGKLKGKTIPIDALMKNTWEASGWDRETGIPTKETLEELDLIRLLEAPEEEFINV